MSENLTGWQTEPLAHFVKEMSDGGTPSRAVYDNFGGDIPWVVITDVQRHIRSTSENLTDIGLARCTAKLWPKDSVILSTGATIGKVGIALVPLATKQGITGIVPNDRITSQFLYYKLLSKKQKVISWAQGSTFAEIRVPILEKIPLEVPEDKGTQRKITRILRTVDRAMEKTEALIEKYKQIKAGLMHDLFTRGLWTQEELDRGDHHGTPAEATAKPGQLRPTRQDAPDLYQETPIGWIPKSWEVKPLDAVATYQHGRPFPSSDYSDEGTLLLRPGNLHVSGFVIFDDAHSTRIPDKWASSEPGYIVGLGDILMNLTAQSLDDEFLGRVCLCTSPDRSMLNQRIARFKPLNIESSFLYWLLRSRNFRNQIDRTSQGTKVQHLYNRDLDRIQLGVPTSSAERTEISSKLKAVVVKLSSEQEIAEKIQKQKSGLMHDLLTGEVAVTPDPEEASDV